MISGFEDFEVIKMQIFGKKTVLLNLLVLKNHLKVVNGFQFKYFEGALVYEDTLIKIYFYEINFYCFM